MIKMAIYFMVMVIITVEFDSIFDYSSLLLNDLSLSIHFEHNLYYYQVYGHLCKRKNHFPIAKSFQLL